MPFTAALALDQGSFGWDDYSRLGDPAIEALCDRIDVVADPHLEGKPHPFGAIVRLTTTKGALERAIADPSGEPDHFPSDATLEAKFTTLARPVIGIDARALAHMILAISKHDTIDFLTRLARPTPDAALAS
jgi:2-methylcitrate dehydratase PrpD